MFILLTRTHSAVPNNADGSFVNTLIQVQKWNKYHSAVFPGDQLESGCMSHELFL